MKKLLTAAALATFALSATAAQAEGPQERSEARLAEMLEGHVAGEPQQCISATRSNRLRVMPYIGIVYDDGDTIYVARAVRPHMLRNSDIPVFERYSSRLCRTDVMHTIDRHNSSFRSALFLEDFVPYTRVEDADDS